MMRHAFWKILRVGGGGVMFIFLYGGEVGYSKGVFYKSLGLYIFLITYVTHLMLCVCYIILLPFVIYVKRGQI